MQGSVHGIHQQHDKCTNVTSSKMDQNEKDDTEEIHELVVRRKQNKLKTNSKTNNITNESDKKDNTNTNTNTLNLSSEQKNYDSSLNQSPESPELPLPEKHETRTQRFKRKEKNWRKNPKYSDIFSGNGVVAQLGQFYEQQKLQQKKKRKRKRKNTSKKTKQIIIQKPLPQKRVYYRLGKVKVHVENEHLEGVKPEDISSLIPKKRIKRVSNSQINYHLPVVF